jgi:hypothetical protein
VAFPCFIDGVRANVANAVSGSEFDFSDNQPFGLGFGVAVQR